MPTFFYCDSVVTGGRVGGGQSLLEWQVYSLLNSFSFSLLFPIKDQCKKYNAFYKHSVEANVICLTMSLDHWSLHGTPESVFVSLWSRKQQTRQGQESLLGAVSPQKAPQGFKTEVRLPRNKRDQNSSQ